MREKNISFFLSFLECIFYPRSWLFFAFELFILFATHFIWRRKTAAAAESKRGSSLHYFGPALSLTEILSSERDRERKWVSSGTSHRLPLVLHTYYTNYSRYVHISANPKPNIFTAFHKGKSKVSKSLPEKVFPAFFESTWEKSLFCGWYDDSHDAKKNLHLDNRTFILRRLTRSKKGAKNSPSLPSLGRKWKKGLRFISLEEEKRAQGGERGHKICYKLQSRKKAKKFNSKGTDKGCSFPSAEWICHKFRTPDGFSHRKVDPCCELFIFGQAKRFLQKISEMIFNGKIRNWNLQLKRSTYKM